MVEIVMESTLKAFKLTHPWFPEVSVTFAAPNAGAARYACWLEISDVWPTLNWLEFSVTRAPEYDVFAELQDKTVRIASESHGVLGGVTKDPN